MKMGWQRIRSISRLLFEFANAYHTDVDPLLLFMLKKNDVKDCFRTFAISHDFVLRKDWWGINEFPLCFTIDASLTLPTTLWNLCMI